MKRLITLILAITLLLVNLSITGAEEYRLGPGDTLEINVWGYEEFEEVKSIKSIMIRPDGNIAFPLAGEVKAEGLSAAQLTVVLTKALSEYMKDPRVTVNIIKFRTTRVYVLGEVTRPGMYEIEKQHNLLDAIGMAGGYTKDAAKKKVFIMHKDNPNRPVKANLLNILEKADMSQNYVLNDGDVVYLTKNKRIDFAKDILPFVQGLYYVKNFNDQ